MSEYQKIHIIDDIIENESSPDRALEVSVYVDTLGAVIVELANSMTIRTNWQGATVLSEMLKDAVATLDELEEQACKSKATVV
jgi:hypothetical protein